MAENVNGEVKVTLAFKAMLEDSNFANLLNKTIQLGLSRNEINYSNKYKDTGFQLYQKYTYKDVCRLDNMTEKTYEKTATLSLIKKDDKWLVDSVEGNKDVLNALSGGLVDAVSNMATAFGE